MYSYATLPNANQGANFVRIVYFKMIDALLMTEGKFNTKPIIERFGVTRAHVSKIIREYKEQRPQNMVYKPEGQGSQYHKIDTFEPLALKGDPEEFLACLDVVFSED